MSIFQWMAAFILLFFPTWSHAANTSTLDLTTSAIGIVSLVIFLFAYLLVMLEEYLKMRKSKPVLLAAGLIWILIGFAYQAHGQSDVAKLALEHNLLE
ncbi:sodium:proton antiporter, partial [Vibrio parahaemolyticus]|nr:sodium:proton antiporter [Vibrio parahaemolyticus]